MTRFIQTILFAIASATSLQASILFDLQGEVLKNDSGSPIPVNSLVLLVADTTNNGFATIADGSSLALNDFLNSGDDRILARYDLTNSGTSGVFAEGPSLTFGGGWDQGDPLALLWFPTLTLGSSTATLGNSYGFFSGPALNGSDAWITPADATNGHKLWFFTSDATVLTGSGSNVASLGNASLTVTAGAVPEPGRFMLSLAGVCALAFRRRRSR